MDQIWLAVRSGVGIALAVVALPLLLAAFGAAVYKRIPARWRPASLTAVKVIAVVTAAVVVLAVTLMPSAYPIHAVNVTPFSDVLAALRSGDGLARSLLNCAGNAALFFPLGMALAVLRPRMRLAPIAAIAALTSLVIELLQYVPAVGRATDVTDVLTNTFGAVAGAVACGWIRRRNGAGGQRGRAVCDVATAVTPTP